MTRKQQLTKLSVALSAQRLAHCIGVEAVAVRMAERFGVDPAKASQAGLLHDCAKNLSLARMEELMRAAGEEPDAVMRTSRALMHAPAGAALAQLDYGENDPEVLRAIRWHTTGCAQMSTLDKIIYLADMIEPGRKSYPGLETIRALCETDLDAAMCEALRQSGEYVREKGEALHPDTQAALDALLSMKEKPEKEKPEYVKEEHNQ